MVRVYLPPKFNVKAWVWYNALPDDLTTWDGTRPATPPDLETDCQLYYPRYGVGRWLHAHGEDCVQSVLQSGFQELRCPKGTDTHAPWGVDNNLKWSNVPLVEVPILTERFYGGMMQDVAHVGFPNEYQVTLLSQIGPVPYVPPPPVGFAQLPAGLALDASGTLPPKAFPRLPAGLALVGRLGSPPGAVQLPAGLALETVLVPPFPGQDLPAGLALDDLNPRKTGFRQLPAGMALNVLIISPKGRVDLPAGMALTANVSSLVFVNPCSGVGMPVNLRITCTGTTGAVGAFNGLTTVVTYNGTNWQGSLTVSGHTGTMTFESSTSAHFLLHGTDGPNWTVSSALMPDTCSCGPPFAGVTSALTTNIGVNLGTTTWSVAPA